MGVGWVSGHFPSFSTIAGPIRTQNRNPRKKIPFFASTIPPYDPFLAVSWTISCFGQTLWGRVGEVGDHFLDLPVLILPELGEVGDHVLDLPVLLLASIWNLY